MTWSGMADKFLFSPFNRIFCSGECSFSPEMTMLDHKIIICDWPMLEYGHETGRLINVLLKLIFQRAWLRRDLAESPNPVLLWQDEYQYFVTKRDNFFQETCRGSRVAVVALTQNILAISEALGETQPGSKTKSLLGNFATKVFMQQNETETCTYAADQIGKAYKFFENFNSSSGHEQGQGTTSVGGSRQLAYLVEPIEFSRLSKPTVDNPLAQSVVYQSGRPFRITQTKQNPKGNSYLSVFFSRE
jgi:type IV secretory pathway TraG/TraD family ATPase VirD4